MNLDSSLSKFVVLDVTPSRLIFFFLTERVFRRGKNVWFFSARRGEFWPRQISAACRWQKTLVLTFTGCKVKQSRGIKQDEFWIMLWFFWGAVFDWSLRACTSSSCARSFRSVAVRVSSSHRMACMHRVFYTLHPLAVRPTLYSRNTASEAPRVERVKKRILIQATRTCVFFSYKHNTIDTYIIHVCILIPCEYRDACLILISTCNWWGGPGTRFKEDSSPSSFFSPSTLYFLPILPISSPLLTMVIVSQHPR